MLPNIRQNDYLYPIPKFDLNAQDIEKFNHELSCFHSEFHDYFKRNESREHFLNYMSGQFSELERKSIEPIALNVKGGNVRAMQRFVSDAPWEDDKIMVKYRNLVASDLQSPDGALIFDESGFAKKGNESIGVSKQYCGNLGKIDNCQVDFFTVPTVTFNILFVLVILSHSRRKVVHFNITSNPTAEWTTQQIVEAFPWDTAPKYLMRDRDAIYGVFFRNRVKNMGIKEVVSVPQSPWQNPFVERVIGSIRRECANNVIVLNQGHLKNILCAYFQYYHNDRTHLSLGKNTPNGRPIQPRSVGKCKIIDLPRIGGLHHRYEWKKAA